MDIQVILFFILVLCIISLIIAFYYKVLSWQFNGDKKVRQLILKKQKSGKISSGKISFPTKDDYNNFNIKPNEPFLFSLDLFEKKYYRIVLCDSDIETHRKFIIITYNLFVTTQVKQLENKSD